MLDAHGLGGANDLPIPASMAIAGGTAALILSFAVLLVAWRQPRYGDASVGTPVPTRFATIADSRWLRIGLRALGLVFFAFVVGAAVFGEDSVINPTFGIVYVWLWVGIVPAALLFGSFYKAVSPARTFDWVLSRLAGRDPGEGVRLYPRRLGYWPAALGLLAFVWLELVSPDGVYLGPVRLWFAIYFAAMLVGSAIFGARWLSRADPFEVFASLVGRLSVWGRTDSDQLVVRSPLRNLAQLPSRPGLVAVVAVLLGSTAYDSFRNANFWLKLTQEHASRATLINTGALLAAVLIVGVTFTIATMASPPRVGLTRRSLPDAFAHSVVPIIVGYFVAHYLTFFVEYGQQTLIQVSDPLSTGANLFGTADWDVNYWLSLHPSALATIKVLAIVTGHVLGVIAAHDRAIRLLQPRHQATGQLPLLAAMVLYTFGGLYLLFGI